VTAANGHRVVRLADVAGTPALRNLARAVVHVLAEGEIRDAGGHATTVLLARLGLPEQQRHRVSTLVRKLVAAGVVEVDLRTTNTYRLALGPALVGDLAPEREPPPRAPTPAPTLVAVSAPAPAPKTPPPPHP
jgi:hypothetical protein